MGFDTHDLLRETGYSSGDFIPVASNGTDNSVSTSSDTYRGYATANTAMELNFGELIPDGATVGGQLICFIDPGSDQIDLRLHNRVGNETLVEETGLTGSPRDVTIGPEPYAPASFDSPPLLVPQLRNGDNATTVSVNRGSVLYGVILE